MVIGFAVWIARLRHEHVVQERAVRRVQRRRPRPLSSSVHVLDHERPFDWELDAPEVGPLAEWRSIPASS